MKFWIKFKNEYDDGKSYSNFLSELQTTSITRFGDCDDSVTNHEVLKKIHRWTRYINSKGIVTEDTRDGNDDKGLIYLVKDFRYDIVMSPDLLVSTDCGIA